MKFLVIYIFRAFRRKLENNDEGGVRLEHCLSKASLREGYELSRLFS